LYKQANFYLLNATCLAKYTALQQLTLDIVEHKSQEVLFTETWFTERHTDDALLMDSLVSYRRDRVERKGGDLCIFVRKYIECEM
jgi:hypothetical protein